MQITVQQKWNIQQKEKQRRKMKMGEESNLVNSPSGSPCRNCVESNDLGNCCLKIGESLATDSTSKNNLNERVTLSSDQLIKARWSTIYLIHYKNHWRGRTRRILPLQWETNSISLFINAKSRKRRQLVKENDQAFDMETCRLLTARKEQKIIWKVYQNWEVTSGLIPVN